MLNDQHLAGSDLGSTLVLHEEGEPGDSDSGTRLMQRVAQEAHQQMVKSTADGIAAVTTTFLAALLESNRGKIELDARGQRLNVPATIHNLLGLLRDRIFSTAEEIVREGGGTGVSALFDAYAEAFAHDVAASLGLVPPEEAALRNAGHDAA